MLLGLLISVVVQMNLQRAMPGLSLCCGIATLTEIPRLPIDSASVKLLLAAAANALYLSPVKSIIRITEPDEAPDFIPEMLVKEACSEKHAVSSTQTPFKAFQIQFHDSLPGTDAQVVLSTWDTLDTLPA